jgi:hypothetical protein
MFLVFIFLIIIDIMKWISKFIVPLKVVPKPTPGLSKFYCRPRFIVCPQNTREL